MKSIVSLFFALFVVGSSAFVVKSNTRVASPTAMMLTPPPMDQASLPTNIPTTVSTTTSNINLLQRQEVRPESFNRHLTSNVNVNVNVLDSTSTMVSVQEYKKPTPEEIAAKKRNFNLWFWGGGFVAPFLATFYYFGFKFWER